MLLVVLGVLIGTFELYLLYLCLGDGCQYGLCCFQLLLGCFGLLDQFQLLLLVLLRSHVGVGVVVHVVQAVLTARGSFRVLR